MLTWCASLQRSGMPCSPCNLWQTHCSECFAAPGPWILVGPGPWILVRKVLCNRVVSAMLWSLRWCCLCDGMVSAMVLSLRWCGLCDGVVSGVLGSMMWHKLW